MVFYECEGWWKKGQTISGPLAVKRRKPNTPYPDALNLKEARDLFLAANGLRIADYAAPTFTIGFWGLQLKFPNTKARKRIVPLHDLHHVLTGYGTDWLGEAEIGAWELRAGCDSFVAYFLNGGGVLIGLVLSPRSVWRAFRAAKGQRTLYSESANYDSILQMSVGEARKRIGIPPRGTCGASR
jgi:hypothetical protein